MTPLDTDDTRGAHLRRLLVHPVALSLGSVLLIAAFVAATLAAGPLLGLAALAGAALLLLAVFFAIASQRAAEDFFASYARARGLSRSPGRGGLPPATPLLRKGDRRYAEQVMRGELPGGLPGRLGLYTYEVESRDSDGDRDVDRYRFTVALHDIPGVARLVEDVHCQRRSGFRFMDSAEDAFRRMQRLELEGEAFDKRYEVFYGANDDEIWLKRLFAPSFIVWLNQAPANFAFELSAGALCVSTKGHCRSAAELDAVCRAAAEVAGRIGREAAE